MSSDVNPLALSREELYELVWSKPMVELAKDFGLSDVAVAKRCRKLGVPVPGRGYWARVAAGQTPRQASLRKRGDDSTDWSALTFDPPKDKEAESSKPPPTAQQNALRERIEVLELKHLDDLGSASPAVKRTALHLKRPWAKEISWGRGERHGAIISINVSEAAADRALRLCERLLVSAQAVGWTFQAPAKAEETRGRGSRYAYAPRSSEPPCFGHLLVEAEALAFRIDERQRQLDHVVTEEERARRRRGEWVHSPRWDFEPTGELRLHMSAPDSRYSLHTWKDRAKARIEQQIPAILTRLLDEALQMKARREEDRLAEIERRREEELRWRQSERRSANAKLIHELEAQAGAWFRARIFRVYLRALRRTLEGRTIKAALQDTSVDFVAWAEHYVDQLDPLSVTAHDSDLKEDRSGYYRSEEKLQQTLARLVGLDWQNAWKNEQDGGASTEHRVQDDHEAYDGCDEEGDDEFESPIGAGT